MTNVRDLTKELATAFDTVKNDRRYCPQAHEMANIAGKLLNAQKLQLEYSKMKGEKPNIEFLEAK
jgi:hypothetical protein